MNLIIALVLVVVVFSILGFIFRSAIKVFLAAGIISVLFILFFGDGSFIVSKITPFLSDDNGQKVEEFYTDFKAKTDEKSLIDTDKFILNIKQYAAGIIKEDELKKDLLYFAESNLTEEKLNKGIEIIKDSINRGTVTEDLINYAAENFSKEKAEAFLGKIRGYFNY